MNPEAKRIIELLGLEAHPEGGFYHQTFRSDIELEGLPQGSRPASTAIYFLLPAGSFSAWHKVSSDEIWHHYQGDAAELHLISPAGEHRVLVLGQDLEKGERPQAVVPANYWQAAICLGARFSLFGCTVAPGFDFSDFEMALRNVLSAKYPEHRAAIERFTRD